MITIGNNRKLHALLNQLGWMERKAELVHSYTAGRTAHSSEMTDGECRELLRWLLSQVQSLTVSQFNAKAEICNKMRRKILSICHELGWETSTGKIDWQKINEYLNKYGYLHKKLNDYSHSELPTLVTQFENLLKTTVYK